MKYIAILSKEKLFRAKEELRNRGEKETLLGLIKTYKEVGGLFVEGKEKEIDRIHKFCMFPLGIEKKVKAKAKPKSKKKKKK